MKWPNSLIIWGGGVMKWTHFQSQVKNHSFFLAVGCPRNLCLFCCNARCHHDWKPSICCRVKHHCQKLLHALPRACVPRHLLLVCLWSGLFLWSHFSFPVLLGRKDPFQFLGLTSICVSVVLASDVSNFHYFSPFASNIWVVHFFYDPYFILWYY